MNSCCARIGTFTRVPAMHSVVHRSTLADKGGSIPPKASSGPPEVPRSAVPTNQPSRVMWDYQPLANSFTILSNYFKPAFPCYELRVHDQVDSSRFIKVSIKP